MTQVKKHFWRKDVEFRVVLVRLCWNILVASGQLGGEATRAVIRDLGGSSSCIQVGMLESHPSQNPWCA